MSLINPKKILATAAGNNYAVGAFNFVNFESLKGILLGARKAKRGVILAVSCGAIKYLGLDFVMGLIKAANIEFADVDFALHLDHGDSFEICKQCIEAGFTSVMIDASALPFDENIELTKQVTSLAHKNGVFCEGELGRISGIEDLINVKSSDAYFTNPSDAAKFINKTNVDSLAISVGTSHGAYKIASAKNLNIEIIKQIKQENPTTFLVLHGASSINNNIVEKLNNVGGKLVATNGVLESEIKKAIKAGISKVNIDSDIRLAFTYAVRTALLKNPSEFDIRKILKPAIEEVSNLVETKITTVLN